MLGVHLEVHMDRTSVSRELEMAVERVPAQSRWFGMPRVGRAVLLLCLFVSPLKAEKPDDASDWFVAPLPSGAPTSEDLAARQELLRQIDQRQSADFRRRVQLSTPEHGTGLPADYDIIIYGEHARRADRLEIQVRGDRARGEYLGTNSERHWAGESNSAAIGQWTREFVYGALTSHQRKRAANAARDAAADSELEEESSERIATSWSHTTSSHASYHRIEVISRDPKHPFRIRTEARQDNVSDIDFKTSGMRGYAHAKYSEHLFHWVTRELPHSLRKDDAPRDVVRRLEEFETRIGQADPKLLARIRADELAPLEGLPSSVFDEDGVQRAVVEARILGAWAVETRAGGALKSLEGLGLTRQSHRLRIVTAEDGGQLWRESLMGKDWSNFSLTLGLLKDRLDPLAVEILLDSLPRLPDEYRSEQVMQALEIASLTAEQLSRIREIHRESKGWRQHVAATRLLLRKTDEESLFRELYQLALEPANRDQQSYDSSASHALEALTLHASRTPDRRKETAVLLRTLLARTSMNDRDPHDRVGYLALELGKVGDASDLKRLELYVHAGSLYAKTQVIEGIAHLDGRRAAELARHEGEQFLNGARPDGSYRWCVYPYLDLFLWQRDRAAIAMLERASVERKRTQRSEYDGVAEEDALLDYLRAERIDDRAAAAVRFQKASVSRSPEWLDAVGRELLAAGADPAVCHPLLMPRP